MHSSPQYSEQTDYYCWNPHSMPNPDVVIVIEPSPDQLIRLSRSRLVLKLSTRLDKI